MSINKSAMSVDGNLIRLSMPFAKVDQEKRLVSGWATLDNIDTQGDVVLADASAKAFSRARGNIREMHQPLAVGKMIDFREDEYYDAETSKFYRGIFVTVRVSEGAEDTWKKVLDETLSGFSIGGEIKSSRNEYLAEDKRTVRFIEDYDLTELSLVDNPANQLADFVGIQKSMFSVQRSESGEVTSISGLAVDSLVENVFICTSDDIVLVKDVDEINCPQCGVKMNNAGWFESVNGNREEKVSEIVKGYFSSTTEPASILPEGGVGENMNKNSEEIIIGEPGSEEVVESTEDENVEAGTEVGAEAPEEVLDESTDIAKRLDALHVAVKTSLEQSKNETLEKVSELENKIDDVKKEFLAKASEIEEKFGSVEEKFGAQKARIASLESSLSKMNSSDAFRKSADVQSAEPVLPSKTSFWGGAFSD